jgi:Phosphomannomutase
MARSGKNCIEIRSLYPEYTISKNKIELKDDIDIPKLLDAIAEKYANYDVNRTDGVKIDFEDSWVHVRSSNTEPILRIYAEALTENIADNIAKKIMLDIREMIQ